MSNHIYQEKEAGPSSCGYGKRARVQALRFWKVLEVMVGVEDEGEDAVTEKITARIRNSDFRLHVHSRMEELFSRIVSICTLIFMDCILCAWSCAKF